MAEAASLALPYPETAVVDESSLTEQNLALAAALPERPVVLGGCCCSHVGAVEGLATRHDRLAVVWLDAHGDLNTPETSPSGNQWGMPFRMLLDSGTVAPGGRGARRRPQPRSAREGVHRRLRAADRGRRASTARSRERTPSTSRSTSTCSTRRTRSSRFMPEPGGLDGRRGGLDSRAGRGSAARRGRGFTGLGPGSRERRAARPACRRRRFLRAAPRRCRTILRWRPWRAGSTCPSRTARPARADDAASGIPTPARAAIRTIATTSSSRRCACARSAAITFPCERVSGSRSWPTAARSSRPTSSFARRIHSSFFDLRAYTDRLAEAEVATGLGDALIAGGAAIERRPCELAVMDFAFMGGSMGSTVGEKFARACGRAAARQVPARLRHGLGRRPHAGGDPLAHAAAQDRVRGRRAARGPLRLASR